MATRKGMMVGKGSGYKNVIGKDPMVHSQSAKGIKQPQRFICQGGIKNLTPNLKTYKSTKNEATLKEIGGIIGVHPSTIIEGFVTPIKNNQHYAIFLRHLYGDYLVEAIKISYKPFNYQRIRYYQTENLQDAQNYIRNQRR